MPNLYIVLMMQLVLCEGGVYLFKIVLFLFSFPKVTGKQGNDSRDEGMRELGRGMCEEPRLQDSCLF